MRISHLLIGLSILGLVTVLVNNAYGELGLSFIPQENINSLNEVKDNLDFSKNNQNVNSTAYKIRKSLDNLNDGKGGLPGTFLAAYDFLISSTIGLATLFLSLGNIIFLPINIFTNLLLQLTQGIPFVETLIIFLNQILYIVVSITIVFFVIRFATGRDDTI